MRYAFHPHKNEKLTVPEYIKEMGSDDVADTDRARCPVCARRLFVVAKSSPDSIGHFSHFPKSGFCPTSFTAAAPYAGLPPRNPDPEAARRIRAAFLANWQMHYLMLDWIVKALSIKEFTAIIKKADRAHIWEYANLAEYQLPYVFATLTDFPPERGYIEKDGNPRRENWFRCWFDATVQRYDDLWIHRETPLLFWRAWYAPQQGQRPKAKDLVDSYSMELSDNFLRWKNAPHPHVQRKISAWLAKNFPIA